MTPGVVYLLGQIIAMRVVALRAGKDGESLSTVLNSWDGLHFAAIAENGYTRSVEAGVTESPAFFPGLPALMRAIHDLTGFSYATTGLLISLISGVALAYGLMRLATQTGYGAETGLIWVLLVALGPLSVVLSMTYTESLFCALAAWALVSVLENRWLVAGVLAFTAGLVRPTGLALAGAVTIAAAIAVHRGIREGRLRWRPIVAACLAPAGSVAYIAVVGSWFGRPGAYFEAQVNGWNTQFDFGGGTASFIAEAVTTAPAVLDIAVVLAIGAALVLLWLVIRHRTPTVLVVYTALTLLSNIGSDGVMNSKVRLMIPAFLLLLPVAGWIARQRVGVRAAALISYGALGVWYSVYGLVIYRYAI